jgi:hypothetical protein
MYWHSTDYKAQGGDVRGALVNRGFWAHLPRLTLACRLTGHVPVVDGTTGFNGRPGSRRVCCDRCGIRPEPQGSLNASEWSIGDRIDMEADAEAFGVKAPPGDWPAHPEGVIGGQLIIGGRVTAGIGVKVGNAGSEHVLAANACLPFLGGLYLHTEGFGTGVQRRLNPVGYESRVISVGASDGRLHWQLWVPRDGYPRHDGRQWRYGSVRIDPRDIILGERRYSYADVSGKEPVILRMPDGGEHQVAMRLQRQSFGRAEGRKRESWTVDCDCKAGIPDRRDRDGGLTGWSVPVGDRAVESGAWQQEAVAASIVKITEMRIRYGYRPTERTAA